MFPSTGYGHPRAQKRGSGKASVYKVQQAHEKPDVETAERFVASGDYLERRSSSGRRRPSSERASGSPSCLAVQA
jgi:hypothetical protein